MRSAPAPQLSDTLPGAVAVVVGVALLRISLLSAVYQRYVKVSARPLLVTSGLVLVALGIAGVLRASRSPGSGHVPRSALLLVVPVVVVLTVSPPALGSYAAARAQTKVLASQLHAASDLPPAVDGVVELSLDDFEERTSVAQNLTTGRFGLLGFVSKDPDATQGEFDLTRITIVCCAADAQTTAVPVAGVGDPPPADTWVHVVGAEVVVDGVPELQADSVTRVSPPRDPYGR